MLTTKKLHPVAVCRMCHGITYRTEAINQRCGRSPRGRRCRGVFRSAVNEGDWKECTACAATGKYEERQCPFCDGIGWHFMKLRAL
jgi:hypothetical protein